MTDHGHFYAGRDVAGTSGRTGDLFEPATGERLGSVALANATEVGAATAAATRGFAAWSQVTPTRRARILARFLRLVEERSDSIGTLERSVAKYFMNRLTVMRRTNAIASSRECP